MERGSLKETLRGRKSETNPRAQCWDEEWRNGSENNPKAGTDETFTNFSVARDTRSALVPNAPRRGRRKKHLTPAPAFPPVHDNRTDDKSSSSSDSSSSSSTSTQAPSGIPQHANVRAPAQTNSRSQQQTAMGRERSCSVNFDCVCQQCDSESSSSGRLHRPSEQPNPRHWTCLLQAKHPRSEGSQMDVRSMTVAGVAISRTEDEGPAEYFDDHEDV